MAAIQGARRKPITLGDRDGIRGVRLTPIHAALFARLTSVTRHKTSQRWNVGQRGREIDSDLTLAAICETIHEQERAH